MPLSSRLHLRTIRRVRARGFTLLEVLVALVVTAIGLLGLAKMQGLAYSSTGNAGVRSVIAIEGSSLAAAMHANRSYWGSSGPGSWAGANQRTIVISLTSNGAINVDDPTLGAAVAGTATCLNVSCSPLDLAAYDLRMWMTNLLPLVQNSNPTATVSCPVNVPVTCRIDLAWNEKATAINAQGTAQVTTATAVANQKSAFLPTYTLYVEP